MNDGLEATNTARGRVVGQLGDRLAIVFGSGDFDLELQRLQGKQPPMERHQWILAPLLVLGVLAVVTIFLTVTGRI